MRYKTHIVVSLAVTVPIMVATETFSPFNLVAVGLGALLPDIDEPNSYIGSKLPGISKAIGKLFGHRGMTHSLIAIVVIGLLMWLLNATLGFSIVLGSYFVAGYFLHILEDSFSKSGIAWFQPFTNKHLQSGGGIVYYTTNSKVETCIFFIAGIALIAQCFIYQDILLNYFSEVVSRWSSL